MLNNKHYYQTNKYTIYDIYLIYDINLKIVNIYNTLLNKSGRSILHIHC